MKLGQASTMVVAVMAAGLAASAQAKDLGTSLRGSWSVDKVAALEAAAPPFYKMATPEKQKEMRDDILKTMPDMIVEFTATTVAMKSGQEAPQLATYKVTRGEKNTVWLDLVPQSADGKVQAAEKYSVEFVDGATARMQKEGDPRPLVLKRIK